MPTPYRDGIFDLFGIAISWGPHQAHDQPLKLPRQLVLQVCNEVLVEGEKGAEGPFAPQHLRVGPGSGGSLLVPRPLVSAVGARTRECSWLYLPIEGLVGLADLHPLLVASGCDEVKDGLLVTACGDSQESWIAHGWAHHSHPAVPKAALQLELGGQAEPS